MAETLPGLLIAQHKRVRWHLLNVGSDGEFHAVQFHGLPFTVHTKEEHRMGVYNLFPGKHTPTHTHTFFHMYVLDIYLETFKNIKKLPSLSYLYLSY